MAGAGSGSGVQIGRPEGIATTANANVLPCETVSIVIEMPAIATAWEDGPAAGPAAAPLPSGALAMIGGLRRLTLPSR